MPPSRKRDLRLGHTFFLAQFADLRSLSLRQVVQVPLQLHSRPSPIAMSIRPSIVRKAGWLVRDAPCVFCLHRSVQPLRRYATRSTIKYRLDPSRTPQEIRNDIDKRNRHAYYRMLQADKLLPCGLEDASKIVNQFIVNQKNNMDPATNARELAKRNISPISRR